jgi:hypothetical protein
MLLKSLKPDTRKKVDNVFECYSGALPLLADVSIADHRQLDMSTYADGSEREYAPGIIALKRENDKKTKYSELLPENSTHKLCVFAGLVMERLGRWGEEGKPILKHLVKRASAIHDVPTHTLMAYWRARLCFAMFKTSAKGMRDKVRMQDILSETVHSTLKAMDWDNYDVVKTTSYSRE